MGEGQGLSPPSLGQNPPAAVKGVVWGRANPQTYIEIDIGGRTQHCLIDTGCDHSLMPRKLIPSVPLHPVEVEVFAANGNPIAILGCITMHFKVGDLPLTADLLVSDDIDEIMLGYDWLDKQKVHWHFDDKVMLLHGKTVPLKIRQSRASCRRVYVRDRVIIPPNTEANVPVRLVRTSFRTPVAAWVIGPKALGEQVFAARVLLPNEDEHAAIRVVNLSDHSFKLEAGHDVGCAEMGIIAGVLPVVGGQPLPDFGVDPTTRACKLSRDEVDLSHLQPVLDSLPDSLTDRQRDEACRFVQGYPDVFSRHEFDLGRTTLLEHQIETGDARPIKQGLRKQPQVHLGIIDAEVEKMVAGGVVEPSCSPWASNVVVVTKQDKTPRITLDYRDLNGVTYKDSYPLPNIGDCLDSFRGSSYFGLLDLRSSFYQVPLAEKDRDKTAFITRKGQWRFRSLPMGLCNSPGTFQRLMDLVLRGLTWSSVLVYIDDIVVYAQSFDQLKERLDEVFQRLRNANLKLKPSKVKLFQKEIHFLGHKVSEEGISMDPEKIDEVVNWAVPKNLHEVRQFLGLCSYYRRFVKDFSSFARPLHELTKKEEPFLWTQVRQDAFDSLKTHLTTGPVLAMSQEEGEFVLDVDASNWAAGAVLQQYQGGLLRVIGYASRTFDKCEIRYCITRKELA